MRRRRVVGIVVLLCVPAALWLAVRALTEETPGAERSAGGSGVVSGGSAGSFSISGDLGEPIVPGRMVPLDLSLGNLNEFDLIVTELTVRVTSVTAPRADAAHPCTAADFAVQAARVSAVTLPAGSVRSLSGLGVPRADWPRVGLRDRTVNQDGCQGASLKLSYAGVGTAVAQ